MEHRLHEGLVGSGHGGRAVRDPRQGEYVHVHESSG